MCTFTNILREAAYIRTYVEPMYSWQTILDLSEKFGWKDTKNFKGLCLMQKALFVRYVYSQSQIDRDSDYCESDLLADFLSNVVNHVYYAYSQYTVEDIGIYTILNVAITETNIREEDHDTENDKEFVPLYVAYLNTYKSSDKRWDSESVRHVRNAYLGKLRDNEDPRSVCRAIVKRYAEITGLEDVDKTLDNVLSCIRKNIDWQGAVAALVEDGSIESFYYESITYYTIWRGGWYKAYSLA